MYDIPFDSRSVRYRDPFGAVPAGTPVHFRVKMPRAMGCRAVTLLMRPDDQKDPLRLGLFWCGMEGDDSEWWECHFTPGSTGIYWYSFICETNAGQDSISALPDGRGFFGSGVSWQLTAYDPAFRTPDWLRGGVIYQVFPDRFYNSGHKKSGVPQDREMRSDWGGVPVWKPDDEGEITNNDYFGGDLEGIVQKLPYLQSLGVTCIYLNPIFEAHANHRYNTADYTKVDPLLGTNDDFTRLCGEAKKRGIRVILDGVFSHTGSDSIYFNRRGRYPEAGAYQSRDSRWFDWYKFTRWPDVYTGWWGIRTLPEVVEENPDYLDFICGDGGIAQRWLTAGASGWRLDVADELPDVLLIRLREATKAQDPDVVIIGEVWEDATNKESYGHRRRFLLGEQLDSVMNYPFREAIVGFLRGGGGADFMNRVMTMCEHYPRPALSVLMNHIGTHDTERILTVLGGAPLGSRGRDWQAAQHMSPAERERGLCLLRLASLLQFTLPGVPCIYYGDEAGVEGYRDPFNRGCFPWGREDQALTEWYKKLGLLRRGAPALRDGDLIPVAGTGSLVAYLRAGAGETLLCAVNCGDSPVDLSVPEAASEGKSLIGPPVRGGLLTLPPLSGAVVVQKMEAKSETG